MIEYVKAQQNGGRGAQQSCQLSRVYVGYFGPDFAGRRAFARKDFFDADASDDSVVKYALRIGKECRTRKGKTLFNTTEYP